MSAKKTRAKKTVLKFLKLKSQYTDSCCFWLISFLFFFFLLFFLLFKFTNSTTRSFFIHNSACFALIASLLVSRTNIYKCSHSQHKNIKIRSERAKFFESKSIFVLHNFNKYFKRETAGRAKEQACMKISLFNFPTITSHDDCKCDDKKENLAVTHE